MMKKMMMTTEQKHDLLNFRWRITNVRRREGTRQARMLRTILSECQLTPGEINPELLTEPFREELLSAIENLKP